MSAVGGRPPGPPDDSMGVPGQAAPAQAQPPRVERDALLRLAAEQQDKPDKAEKAAIALPVALPAPDAPPQATVAKEKVLGKRKKGAAALSENGPAAKKKAPSSEEDVASQLRGSLLVHRHLKDNLVLLGALRLEGAKLKTLDLQGLKPNEEDIKEICTLCPNLMVLNVRDCSLTDTQVEELAKLPSLIHLDIGGDNAITHKAVLALAQQSSLKEVRFDGCTHLFTQLMNNKEGLEQIHTVMKGYYSEIGECARERLISKTPFPQLQADSRNAVLTPFIEHFISFLKTQKKDTDKVLGAGKNIYPHFSMRYSEDDINALRWMSDVSLGSDDLFPYVMDLRGKTVDMTNLPTISSSETGIRFLFDERTTLSTRHNPFERDELSLNTLLKEKSSQSETYLTPFIQYLLIKIEGDITKLPESIRPLFLKKMEQVREFSLENIPLTKENVSILAPHFSKVESLNLKNTHLTDELLKEIIACCPQLREIHVDNNPELTDTALQLLLTRNVNTITFSNTKFSDSLIQMAFAKEQHILQKEGEYWTQAIEKSSLPIDTKKLLQNQCALIIKNAIAEVQLFPKTPYNNTASITQEKIVTSLIHALTKHGEEVTIEKTHLCKMIDGYFSIALSSHQANRDTLPLVTPLLKNMTRWVENLSLTGEKGEKISVGSLLSQFPLHGTLTLNNYELTCENFKQFSNFFSGIIDLSDTCSMSTDEMKKLEAFVCAEIAKKPKDDKWPRFPQSLQRALRFLLTQAIKENKKLDPEVIKALHVIGQDITTLYLSHISFRTIEDLQILKCFPNLNELFVSHCHLTDAMMKEISDTYAGKLYNFSIEGNKELSSLSLRSYCTALSADRKNSPYVSLDFSGIPFQTVADLQVFESFPQPHGLTLNDCNLTDTMMKVLSDKYAGTLTELHVDNNKKLSRLSLLPFSNASTIKVLTYNGKDTETDPQVKAEQTTVLLAARQAAIAEEVILWKRAIQATQEIPDAEKEHLGTAIDAFAKTIQEKVAQEPLFLLNTFPDLLCNHLYLDKDLAKQVASLRTSYLTQALLHHKFDMKKVFVPQNSNTTAAANHLFTGLDIRNFDITRAWHVLQFSGEIDLSNTKCTALQLFQMLNQCNTYIHCEFKLDNITIDGSPQEFTDLLIKAYKKKKMNLVAALLPRVDPKVKTKGELTPLRIACDPELEEAEQIAFLKRCSTTISDVDSNGDTAFHIVCGLGDRPKLILAFLERGTEFDPLHKNKKGETPFDLLCEEAEEEDEVKIMKEIFSGYDSILKFANWHSALAALRSQKDPTALLLPSDKKKLQPLEIAFLTESASLSAGMAQKLSSQELANACTFILKKYPQSNPAAFIEAMFLQDPAMLTNKEFLTKAVDVAYLMKNSKLMDRLASSVASEKSLVTAIADVRKIHAADADFASRWQEFASKIVLVNKTVMKKQIGVSRVPPAPDTISLNGLLDIFKEMNFSDPTQPNYIDPERILREAGVKTVAELAKGLLDTATIKQGDMEQEVEVGLIGYVRRQVAYLGTPAEGSEGLTFFYKQIDFAMKHVIAKLKSLPNTPEARNIKEKVLIEFLQACPPRYCGGRIFTNAIQIYNRVINGVEPTLENLVLQSLASYRDTLLQSLMVGPDVHEYTLLARKLGIELGIPTANLMIQFDDKYVPVYPVNIDEARKKFLERYIPSTIVSGWLKTQLETDQSLKNDFIDWCKANIPKSFEEKKFNDIRAFVQAKLAEKVPIGKIREEISTRYDIDLNVFGLEVEELEKACIAFKKEQWEPLRAAINEEVAKLKEEGKPDGEIKAMLKRRFQLQVGEGNFRQALDTAITAKIKREKNQLFKTVKERVEALRDISRKPDKEIAQILKADHKLNVSGASFTEAIEEARGHLYLEREVIEDIAAPKMKFKEARVYDLCKALKIFTPLL